MGLPKMVSFLYYSHTIPISLGILMGLAVKKKLGWLGHRDEILPSFIGIIVRHEIRIPIKQPVYWA